MRVVILYETGVPVKLNEQFDEGNLQFTTEGFLQKFTFKENEKVLKYRFYNRSRFKSKDLERKDLESGYYIEDQFLNYIGNVGAHPPNASDMIQQYRFNFNPFLAKAKDAINIEITDFEWPFDYFYGRKSYSFLIENTVDNRGIFNYAESIYDGADIIDYKIKTPVGAQITGILLPDQPHTAGGYFFAKNLGDHINLLEDDAEKRKLKKIAILIVFRIREIMKDIFPKLLTDDEFINNVDSIANNPTLDIDTNTPALYVLVFNLKKYWGYYYDPTSSLPHRNVLPVIFDAQATYDDFLYYYIGLFSFYRKAYDNQHKFSLASFNIKFKYRYLLEILPVNALSIVPIDIVKEILEDFIKRDEIVELEEQFIVRLVLSIAKANADEFLDFLLDSQNCINTNFEIIFNLLDDARIQRFFFIINWISNEKTNRMAFIYAVHELWKVSKYSFYDSYQLIKNNSYFLTHVDQFYYKTDQLLKTVVLECGRLDTTVTGDPAMPLQTNTWVDYETDKTLKKDLVTITKNSIITHRYLSSSGKDLGPASSLDKNYSESTDYHLYQSLNILGHVSDDRVILPNGIPIPAFLFYYTEDFERLLKIDAQIALTINVGIEVVLFFTTGGLTQLKNLQYLKYITKINSALGGAELAEAVQVLRWSGLEAGSQTISVTAGIMYSLGLYNETILPTAKEREAQANANIAFLYIALAFGGGSLYFKQKAVMYAEYALSDPVGLGSMPSNVRNILNSVVGEAASSVTSFETKLSDLPNLVEPNIIASRYISYTDEVKRAFYRDFGLINETEKDFWNTLNKATTLDNWEALRDLGVLERNEIAIIKETAIRQAYETYYGNLITKPVLEKGKLIDRLAFFDEFGNVAPEFFDKLIENSEKITEWMNLDGAKRLMLNDNRNFWLINDLDNGTIAKLQVPLEKAKNTAIGRPGGANWFTDSTKKIRAKEFLDDGDNWSNGLLVEIPAQNYLKSIINSNENVYLSIDIAFYNNKGKKISALIQELDGLLINNNTGKIEEIISMKLNGNRHNFSTDELKLNLMKDLPDNGINMKNYILNHPLLNKVSLNVKENAVEARIIYTDLKTGIEIKELPSVFKLKIKPSYDVINDFQKIHPEVLNTTKTELIESSYQSIKNKF